MALNAKNVPQVNKGNRVEQEPLEPGSYPARVVQIIDRGLQPQKAWEDEPKAPAHEIMLTYELLDEFCKDEDGEEDETKPRWLSEYFPLRNLAADLAKSTKRYKALDPDEVHEGDFSQLIGTPCTITVVNSAGKGKNAGKIYNNIGAVSAMRPRDAKNAPELVNEPKVFSLDEPNVETFLSLPQWLQEVIQANLEYDGSALQKALKAHQKGDDKQPDAAPKGKAKKPVEEPVEAEEGEDDIPW